MPAQNRPGHPLNRIKRDIAALLDATRHDDLGPELDAVRLRLEAWLHVPLTVSDTDDYETGYREGESSREFDVRYAVEYSRTWNELLDKLRSLTGGEPLELGAEVGGPVAGPVSDAALAARATSGGIRNRDLRVEFEDED